MWAEMEPVSEFKSKTLNRDGLSQRDEILKSQLWFHWLTMTFLRTGLYAQSEQKK